MMARRTYVVSSSRNTGALDYAMLRSIKQKHSKFRKRDASQFQPAMADLPVERVAERVFPFTNTRIDYFGPFEVKLLLQSLKLWCWLFTCLTRETWKLFSDQGTNFVGAANDSKNSSIAGTKKIWMLKWHSRRLLEISIHQMHFTLKVPRKLCLQSWTIEGWRMKSYLAPCVCWANVECTAVDSSVRRSPGPGSFDIQPLSTKEGVTQQYQSSPRLNEKMVSTYGIKTEIQIKLVNNWSNWSVLLKVVVSCSMLFSSVLQFCVLHSLYYVLHT